MAWKKSTIAQQSHHLHNPHDRICVNMELAGCIVNREHSVSKASFFTSWLDGEGDHLLIIFTAIQADIIVYYSRNGKQVLMSLEPRYDIRLSKELHFKHRDTLMSVVQWDADTLPVGRVSCPCQLSVCRKCPSMILSSGNHIISDFHWKQTNGSPPLRTQNWDASRNFRKVHMF